MESEKKPHAHFWISVQDEIDASTHGQPIEFMVDGCTHCIAIALANLIAENEIMYNTFGKAMVMAAQYKQMLKADKIKKSGKVMVNPNLN